MSVKDDNYSNLKDTLKLLRIAHGSMSMRDLAKELGVSAAYIGYIESEKSDKKPSLGLLDKYAAFFGIRTSDIFRLAECDPGETYQCKLRKVLDLLISNEESSVSESGGNKPAPVVEE